jgi:folate-binding protein YgfZ
VRVHPLDKTVFRLAPRAAEFLRAYATNAPERPLTAFLDARGRVVAAAEAGLSSADEALVAVASGAAAAFEAHLGKYLPVVDTCLTRTGLGAWLDVDGALPAAAGAWTIEAPYGRLVLAAAAPGGEPLTPEAFTRLRLDRGWPLQGVDFHDEMLLCVGERELVSYDKGCYLGQEVVARVHYKGRPPKRLAVAELSKLPSALAATATSVVPGPGGARGFVFIPEGSDGPGARFVL